MSDRASPDQSRGDQSILTHSADFQGTERFTVQRRLGSGGFGVVYQVYDHDENSSVALKLLTHTDAGALYRFKREFRALAGVSHPNLITLHELMSDGQQWFFTMELIEGTSFLEYVRGEHREGLDEAVTASAAGASASSAVRAVREAETQTFEPRERPTGHSRIPLSVDLNRLRAALRQLVDGVSALHQMGQLHRDLKPSNVLVDRKGRVVVLDFGLVTELVPEDSEETVQLIGTAGYLSPEHAAGLPVSEASDWYSVGVMLYEALTGRLPFSGPVLKVLLNKQKLDVPNPRQLVEGIPDNLTDLCRALLRRDPRQRPSEQEILRRLEEIGPADSTPLIAPRRRAVHLVGRESHLDILRDAYRATNQGRTVAVFVHGSSGMGKTALVQHFLDQLRQKEDVVILDGRCYERESVPYKALDSVVDALSQYLRGLSTAQVEGVLPRDVLALSRLFPVLRQVPSVAWARRRLPEIPDSQELRRRAFAALRDLLARLSEQKPIVLSIDDLQWGDVDSVALLEEILSPPDPPGVLLIAGYRSEEAETSPTLQKLLAFGATRAVADTRELVVGKLNFSEVRALVLFLLGENSQITLEWIETIARESGGNPYFIHELVRFCLASFAEGSRARMTHRTGIDDVGEITLEKVIEARVSRLPEPERRFLEVIAVAGQPITMPVARQAAVLDTHELAALATLRSERLVRIRGPDGHGDIEIYHDRIRETVVGRLSPMDLKSHHCRLAFALEASGRADAETLAVHFQGAGDIQRAAEYATKAAEQAIEALAFDRAVRLYRFVLKLGVLSKSEAQNSRVKLADALANGGRGTEAAQEYLAASEETKSAEKLELQRRAVEQFLRSGYIDDGIKLLRTVLASIGMKLAATPRRALLSLLLQRTFIWMRGLGFRERDPSRISPDELIRVDTCWSVAAGLGMVDNIRGADFHKRHLLLALRTGEPYRVARALALEVSYSASGGSRSRSRTQRLAQITQELADRIKQPHALGLAALTAGIAAYLEGRWREGVLLTSQAASVLREGCTGVAWELANAEIFRFLSLYYLGDLNQLSDRLPEVLRDVEDRGDLFAATSLRARVAFIVRLAVDAPDEARRDVEHAIQRWSHQAFHIQHLWAIVGKMEIALYCGDVVEAWNVINGGWPGLARSLILRVQQPFVGALHHRARCALAMASVAGPHQTYRAELLRSAERDARRIERERTMYGDGLSRLVGAGVAATRGYIEEAATLADRAEIALLSADMGLYAAAARRRRGELLGGDQGRALIADADAWMSNQKVKNPRRMVEMLAPGKWGTG